MDNNGNEGRITQAQDAAEKTRQEFNLDYSLDSLRRVDELLASLGDCGDDLAGEAAYMMGCYVGEVLVRQAGGEWTVDEDKKQVFGSPLLLRAGHIQASPITRCFKRMKSDSDGVEAWGRLLVALASGNFPEEVSDSGDEEVEWQTQGF
jgi:hypothetical protein